MNYLTIDIGASSGRHILGKIVDGKMVIEEIYRFKNQMTSKNGSLCWNLSNLFEEIKKGLKRCATLDCIPDYIGIDTWGVDFVLLDENNHIIGDTISYRDHRTDGMDLFVDQLISQSELYKRTGIQKQLFNTIYQLVAISKKHPEQIEQAKAFLMLPDYFHFLLTGEQFNEYTNATTTPLVNLETYTWDDMLINRLGLPVEIFKQIKPAGAYVGRLTDEIISEIGFDCEVIMPATHDTASAFMAVSSEGEDSLIISSGTWSLIGSEIINPITSEGSMTHNFSNSGGFEKRFLFLKNIVGLWVIQEYSKEIGEKYTFSELCEMAERENIRSIVDLNDKRFFAPKSMAEAVKSYCEESEQRCPKTVSEMAAVIYNSLVESYAEALKQMMLLTGKSINTIQIIGGGSNAEYVNQRTADVTGLKIISGPVEATAIGNLVCQMISTNVLSDIREARDLIQNSFNIKTYFPREIKND